jgi:hypothetical protein
MNPYANTSLAKFDVEALYAQGAAIFERNRTALERDHWGEYCLVDLKTEKVFTARTEDEAFRRARSESPNGFFTTFGIGFDSSDRLMSFLRHG